MSTKGATIQVRVDPSTKSQVSEILDGLGIRISDAITMYLRQIILNDGIPFDLKLPNKLTAKTLDNAKAGKDLHEVASVEKLFEELDS